MDISVEQSAIYGLYKIQKELIELQKQAPSDELKQQCRDLAERQIPITLSIVENKQKWGYISFDGVEGDFLNEISRAYNPFNLDAFLAPDVSKKTFNRFYLELIDFMCTRFAACRARCRADSNFYLLFCKCERDNWYIPPVQATKLKTIFPKEELEWRISEIKRKSKRRSFDGTDRIRACDNDLTVVYTACLSSGLDHRFELCRADLFVYEGLELQWEYENRI